MTKLKEIYKKECTIQEFCRSGIIEAVKKSMCNTLGDIYLSQQNTKLKDLYHYCSLETFYSIIESNCFWLSHPKFMNDLSEHKYAIGTTNKFLQEYNKTIDENDASKDLLNLMESNLKKYEEAFVGADEDKYKKLAFFTCFSSDGDSLPMWSMYKGKNIGLAIGLDFLDEKYFVDSDKDSKNEKMSPFADELCCFSNMRYEEDKIKKEMKIFLDFIRHTYSMAQKKFNTNAEKAKSYLSIEVPFSLINMSLNLKNNHFDYEKETRMMFFGYKEEDVKFRVRDKFIVPYIEFPLKEVEEEKEVEDENKNKKKIKIKVKKKFSDPIIPIKSITISPNAEERDLVIASIRAYLNHKGYNINKIKIDQSTIPYKPR